MGTIYNRFQGWLLENRKTLLSRFSTDEQETPEPEKSLIELPSDIASELIAAVDDLPTDNPDIEAIQSKLDEALEKWRKNPQAADNSLITLSSPVATVSRTLTESLQDWASERKIPLRPLQWIGRPEEPESIKIKLQQQLGRGFVTTDSKQPEIVVISNLSWCFLRCVDGLDGIDYLQDVLLQDDSRFWVIGAGKVGWEYLDHVSHFKAYCGQSLDLPQLTGEELQTWFEPIVSKFKITFAKPDIEFTNTEDPVTYQSRYFEKLASVSEGVNTVAAQVFLSSIRYQVQQDDNDNDEKAEKILEAQNPELPNLPRLSAEQQYILYSLLLHGDLTLATLSQSLGDDTNLIKGQVQTLRRKGLIEKKGKTITINPIHYPRLKSELANNNFIIHESD